MREKLDTVRSDKEEDELERQHKQWSEAMIIKRDDYIARQIHNTLLAGETGMVFLCMVHSMDGLLPPDIGLTMLDQTPPRTAKKIDDTDFKWSD